MSSSYYGLEQWQLPQRQASWEQPPPSRSGASSVTSREEVVAFAPQFEEVDRAIDNLAKSGKYFGRRDQFGGQPGRQFNDSRSNSRPQSVDFDPMRAQPGNNLQNFYGNARYPPRSSDGDPMQQAKRRMAAQRERELRNYHQEQQYNKSISTTQVKSDRSASPSTMNDDDRRGLLTRQHKALYGEQQQQQQYGFNDQNTRSGNANFEEDPRSATESSTSPATGSNNFGTFDPQQTSRTSASSPGEGKSAVAPGAIGTRPTTQAVNPALAKRNTPPTSSPLSFGFGDNTQNERTGSAASNPASGRESMTSSGNWGTSSGVWGKGSLTGVSSTVWG